METVSPIVAMGSLVIAFTNFVRMISGKNWSGVATQVLAWAAGVAAILLTAQADIADSIPTIGGLALSKANFASQAIVGLVAASAGGVFVNLTKALDSSDSAKFPSLLHPRAAKPQAVSVPDERPPGQL